MCGVSVSSNDWHQLVITSRSQCKDFSRCTQIRNFAGDGIPSIYRLTTFCPPTCRQSTSIRTRYTPRDGDSPPVLCGTLAFKVGAFKHFATPPGTIHVASVCDDINPCQNGRSSVAGFIFLSRLSMASRVFPGSVLKRSSLSLGRVIISSAIILTRPNIFLTV